MDLAHDYFAPNRRRPVGRAGRRRRHQRSLVPVGSRVALAATRLDSAQPYCDSLRSQPPSTCAGSTTVEELTRIPGAREALANYIGILQEWSSRADEGGAAP